MIVRRTLFFIKKALENIHSNLFASAMSAFTLALCLIVLGASIMVSTGVRKMAPSWMMDSKAVAYLKDDIQFMDQLRVAEELRKWPAIREVTIVSKDEAWSRLKNQLGKWRGILEGLDENPLPPSLEIGFEMESEEARKLIRVVGRIQRLPEVDEVYYGRAWAEKMESFLQAMRFLTVGLVGLLGLASVLIVSNTMKLSIFSRKDELEIYSVIGATPMFTKLPFYLEGFLQGILSGMVATGALLVLLVLVERTVPLPIATGIGWGFWDLPRLFLFLSGFGIVLNWIGCAFALHRFYEA